VPYFDTGPTIGSRGIRRCTSTSPPSTCSGRSRRAPSCTSYRRELNLLPHKLAELIRSAELTQWFSRAVVLNYWQFDVDERRGLPSCAACVVR